MKRVILTATALSALTILSISCVDKTYDLNNLNDKITIIPGIRIPIEDGDLIDDTLQDFLDAQRNGQQSEGGSAMIDANNSQTTSASMSPSALSSGSRVKIDGEIVSEFDDKNEFLSIPGIGKVLVEPSVKVSVTNPSPTAIHFQASVSDGTHQPLGIDVPVPANGTYSLYISENGNARHLEGDRNCINVSCKGFKDFFNPNIPEAITISEMSLYGETTKSALGDTKGDDTYTVSLSSVGLVDLTFAPNSEFTYNTTVELPTNFSVADYNFDIDDEIVLAASVEKKGVLFDFTPTVTSYTDEVLFTFDPAKISASKENENFTLTGRFLTFPEDHRTVDLSILIKNPSSETVSIKGDETIKFTLISLTSTNGINL